MVKPKNPAEWLEPISKWAARHANQSQGRQQ
jgi:hypothetical protein